VQASFPRSPAFQWNIDLLLFERIS